MNLNKSLPLQAICPLNIRQKLSTQNILLQLIIQKLEANSARMLSSDRIGDLLSTSLKNNYRQRIIKNYPFLFVVKKVPQIPKDADW